MAMLCHLENRKLGNLHVYFHQLIKKNGKSNPNTKSFRIIFILKLFLRLKYSARGYVKGVY